MNFFKLKLNLLIVPILLLIVGVSCTKLEDLKDIDLYVDTDLLLNPLTVQILDANVGEDLPDGIKITALGNDKDKIYTQLGEKALVVEHSSENKSAAILPISVRKINPPSLANSIDFTLKIEAPGYLTTFKSYSIINEENTLDIVKLNKKASTSEGVSFESETFTSESTGTNAIVSFGTAAKMGEGVIAKINAQTLLYNKAGEQINGTAEVSLFQYNIHSNKGLNTLPGGLVSYHARGLDGDDLGIVGLTPIGAISLDITIDGEEVKTFSSPIEMTFEISNEMINPNTKEAFLLGDEIEVWSYNENIGEWQLENTALVTQNLAGNLQVRYEQEHLSTWIIGVGSNCARGANITILSDIAFNAPQRYFYSEIVNTANDEVIGTPKFFRYYDGEVIRFRRSVDVDAVLRVYSGFNEDCKGNLLAESAEFNLCTGNYTFDFFTELTDDDFFSVNINIRGICSSDFNDLVILPTLVVLFRESGCVEWSQLGTLISGHGSTGSLEKARTYDFRLPFRGLDRSLMDFEIPAENMQIEINSPVYDFNETIDIIFTNEGKSIDLNYTDIQVPDLACQEYLDIFGTGRGRDRDPD